MAVVTVSPKYQIVIPKEIHESMEIEPGQKLQIFQLEGVPVLVPVRPITQLRGAYPGIDTHIVRDRDRV